MLLLSKRRFPVELYALIVLGCSLSWSFTATQVIGWRRVARDEKHVPHLSMVVSTTESDFDRDSSVMKSVTEARTTKELGEMLSTAFRASNALNSTPRGSMEEFEFVHLNDTTIEETLRKFPQFSMDILAAALRRLALISAREKHSSDDIQRRLLASLLDTIGDQMVVAQRGHGILGVYPLADILQALAILSYADVYADASDCENLTVVLDNLVDSAIEMLSRHDASDLRQLGPIRLLQCLQAMARLGTVESPLHFRIYAHLLKPNSSSRIPAKYLAHGLDALATVVNNRAGYSEPLDNDAADNGSFPETKLLLRAFMRRLRKQKVREEATIDDLCRALLATDDLWHSGGLKELEDEAAIFGFTALQAILQKKRVNGVQIHPGQMATMVSAWATFTNTEKKDTVIDELLFVCIDDCVLERSSLLELERIISSIQQFQIANHSDILRIAGDRLVCLTLEGKVSPKPFNSILRCPVLLYRKNNIVMKPYLRACENAFLDKNFLAKCSTAEIANFLWFASIARWRHEGALEALGQRILDPRVIDNCTPKLASRILATYTSILSLPKNIAGTPSANDDFPRGLTSQLFHSYGGHLLTSKLSPAEVSSALHAYAKASYFHDMGIFDHLVSMMAEMSRAPDAPSARQMAQSLWSCGKMSVWETGGYSSIADQCEEESTKDAGPPCVQSAYIIATALSERAHELTRVDVTQCIWALGRLGAPTQGIVVSFALRAAELAHEMNAVEVSNILWGLSRVNFVHHNLVDQLMARLTSKEVEVSPKEAAMALYALARLGVGDEDVYNSLSDVMIARIDKTSAQAVANTLWAYRNVNLRPPQQLLNLWAVQKLGLASARSIDLGV